MKAYSRKRHSPTAPADLPTVEDDNLWGISVDCPISGLRVDLHETSEGLSVHVASLSNLWGELALGGLRYSPVQARLEGAKWRKK